MCLFEYLWIHWIIIMKWIGYFLSFLPAGRLFPSSNVETEMCRVAWKISEILFFQKVVLKI